MDKDLFKALFEDKDLDFSIDGKRLEVALEKSNRGRTASSAMFGGLELFEGKLPENPDDSAATLDSLREKGVKEDTAGVAKTPEEEKIAGVVDAETGDVKVGTVVKEDLTAADPSKVPASTLKVLARGISDEMSAKQLAQEKQGEVTTDDQDPKKFMVVQKAQGSGIGESYDASFTRAMKAYQAVVSEGRKKIKEEKDPLNAGLTALKNTIQNMLNFYSAGDMKQSVEYANLATKQAADIGANLQTMASAEEAAAGVHGAGGEVPAGDAVVSADATATADSLPTGGTEDVPVGDVEVGAEEEFNIPEEDVEVSQEDYDQYESKYTSLEEAHVGFKALQKDIQSKGTSKESAAKIAASVGRKKYGKDKFQAMAVKGKKAQEGKLPTNTPDDSQETMDQLYEKRVQECAEKAYLVLKLKERSTLTEKEKSFIKTVESEQIDEKLRKDAKVFLEKMLKVVKK